MGNNFSNKNNAGQKKENVVDTIDIKSIIKNINQNKKNQLIDFLLSNVTMMKNIKKVKKI